MFASLVLYIFPESEILITEFDFLLFLETNQPMSILGG